ncbi:MAG: UPF0236 family transposase-like protein [Planctomycetota bacterium]|jgi:hypothetical protein
MQARELLVPVRIVIEGDVTVKSIDRAVQQAWREFPSLAWQATVRAVEAVAVRQNCGRLRVKSYQKRTLWTSAGNVAFRRRRFFYADRREEGSFHVFDMRVGLERYERFVPEAKETCAKLASIAPSYRKSSEIARLLLGDAPSDWTIWRRTQEEGERLRKQDAEERRSVFRDGDLPGSDVPPKRFVVVEADSGSGLRCCPDLPATMVHRWKKKAEHHEVYLGIAYDGKEKVGRNRWRLTDKVHACGVYGSKVFGEDLFVAAQKKHNIVDAETTLFLSDGDPALEEIRRNHFPQAPHQIDQRHVTQKVRSAYGWDRLEEAKTQLGHIFAEDRDAFERQSSFDRLRFHERRSKLDDARAYVENHWDELFTYRELKRTTPDLPPHMNGTGAMERNIGTVVGHRMKHRGMGWTRKGAANIMRVRLEMVAPTTS